MRTHSRHRNHPILIGLGAAALLAAGATARAEDKPTAANNSETATVLGKLHHANQMEIEMGKLAQKNGATKEVKAFGKTLVQDHTASDKKVTALAKKEKIDLNAAAPPMKPEDQATMDRLKTEKGAAFDKTFSTAMVEDHKQDVSEATAARDSTTDPKLKALLTETVPVLEKHRDTAEKLATTTAAP
jgi:putative membrane protein